MDRKRGAAVSNPLPARKYNTRLLMLYWFRPLLEKDKSLRQTAFLNINETDRR